MPLGASFNAMAVDSNDGLGIGFQTATRANASRDSTSISNAATNGNPNAVVFETPNASLTNGTCSCVSDPSPTGIWWSHSTGQAAVFDEEQSPMPLRAHFNLIIYQS